MYHSLHEFPSDLKSKNLETPRKHLKCMDLNAWHLYPLISKVKKKSNQASYLESIHLSSKFSYALFISWIIETSKPK